MPSLRQRPRLPWETRAATTPAWQPPFMGAPTNRALPRAEPYREMPGIPMPTGEAEPYRGMPMPGQAPMPTGPATPVPIPGGGAWNDPSQPHFPPPGFGGGIPVPNIGQVPTTQTGPTTGTGYAGPTYGRIGGNVLSELDLARKKQNRGANYI